MWRNGSTVLITLSLHFLTDEFWGFVSGAAETPLCVCDAAAVWLRHRYCVLCGAAAVWLRHRYCALCGVVSLGSRFSDLWMKTIASIFKITDFREQWELSRIWRLFLSKRLQPIAQRRNVMFYKSWVHFPTGCILSWLTFWHIAVCLDFSRLANVCWLRNIRVAGQGGRTQKENTSN
jgi:hypothetical protein